MVASGTYSMLVRYFPPSDGIVVEEVQLPFEYRSTTAIETPVSTTSGAIERVTNNTNVNNNTNANVTNVSSASATTTSSTSERPLFHSANDSFSMQIPQGWVIQDLNNTGLALSNETTKGYGILAQLCTV